MRKAACGGPLKCVVSPPYEDSRIRQGDKDHDTIELGDSVGYGQTPGQIGVLKEKEGA